MIEHITDYLDIVMFNVQRLYLLLLYVVMVLLKRENLVIQVSIMAKLDTATLSVLE